MSFFLFFVFLIIGGTLFLIFYKYYKDILNPLGIFSIVWFFSIGISQLMLSNIQHPWTNLTWFTVLVSSVNFIMGGLSYSFFFASRSRFPSKIKLISHYSKIRLKTAIVLLFIISLLAYLFEVWQAGGVPLFSEARIGAYMGFGVRFVHYLTVSSILVCILVYLHRKLFPNDRKLLLNIIFIVSLFIIVSLLASGQLLTILIGIFVIKYYLSEKRLKLKNFIWLIIFSILVFTLLTGFIRSSQPDITYIKQIGKPTIDIPDRLSPIFLPYLYISTSFENLQLEILNREKFYYGSQTTFPIWAFTQLKNYFQPDYYITPEGFNVGTYLRPYYIDFGLPGVLIFPFLLGLFISILYHSLRSKLTILKMLVYSLCVYGLTIVFFANIFSSPGFWYFLILFIIIDLYCRKGLISQKNNRCINEIMPEVSRGKV